MSSKKKEIKQLELPSVLTKDSWFYEENSELCEPYLGRPYISNSTHTSFNDYFDDFVKEKLGGIDLGPKIYAEFGTYVGEAIENGAFHHENPNMFDGQENLDLTRKEGVEYEKMIIIDRGSYIILGFIDKYYEVDNKAHICDVKTGGKNKEKEYMKDEYIQVMLYAHAIENSGKEIGKTYIEFIRREGSHINPPLIISEEQFKIDLLYSKERVDYALKAVDKTAKGLEKLYKTFNKYLA